MKQPVADQGSLGHLGTSRDCIVSAPAAQAACREGGRESCEIVAVAQNCSKNPISSFHMRIAHREKTVTTGLNYVSVRQKDSYPIIKEILESFRPLLLQLLPFIALLAMIVFSFCVNMLASSKNSRFRY